MTTEAAISIPFAVVADFLEHLGFDDTTDVMGVTISPRRIEVEHFRYNTDGKPYAAGDRVATTVTAIAITEPESDGD